ncbi:MAG: hypothetical protein PHW73_11925 [Atribacterota bacterium]|nr:hypothetical protein [Atribacterota bacterium]
MKKFIRPLGHEKCKVTSNIAEAVSFGSGRCDEYGFWEKPCSVCARAWEAQFPEDGECWPFKKDIDIH